MSLENQNIPAEVLTEAENMMKGGFNLKVPEEAEAIRKNGFTRWDEYAVVEEAYHEEKKGKADQQRTVFVMKSKILPINGSINATRTYTEFLHVNFGALRGDESTIGNGSLDGERKMSSMSVNKLRQIAVSLDLDISEGLSSEVLGQMFPALIEMPGQESFLVGQKFAFTMVDDARPEKQYKGQNSQSIDSIAAAPEGV